MYHTYFVYQAHSYYSNRRTRIVWTCEAIFIMSSCAITALLMSLIVLSQLVRAHGSEHNGCWRTSPISRFLLNATKIKCPKILWSAFSFIFLIWSFLVDFQFFVLSLNFLVEFFSTCSLFCLKILYCIFFLCIQKIILNICKGDLSSGKMY